jgi:transposase
MRPEHRPVIFQHPVFPFLRIPGRKELSAVQVITVLILLVDELAESGIQERGVGDPEKRGGSLVGLENEPFLTDSAVPHRGPVVEVEISLVGCGLLTPDNNAAENAIRSVAMGRKNWLLAGVPKGADASAMLFSLVETAKANEIEPQAYLKFLFERFPAAQTMEEMRALMP